MYRRCRVFTNFDIIVNILQIERAPEIWGPSEATYPEAGLYFLRDDFVAKVNDILGLLNECIVVFSEEVSIIRVILNLVG